MANSKFNFGRIRDIVQNQDLFMGELSKDAVNFFQDSFAKQGWTNNGFKKWKEVKRRTPGTKEYKYGSDRDKTRSILVGRGSGKLRRSIHETSRSKFRLIIATDVDYAQYHNEGTDNMPKRQFMGDSPELVKKQLLKITKIMDNLFKINP